MVSTNLKHAGTVGLFALAVSATDTLNPDPKAAREALRALRRAGWSCVPLGGRQDQ